MSQGSCFSMFISESNRQWPKAADFVEPWDRLGAHALDWLGHSAIQYPVKMELDMSGLYCFHAFHGV